jgi:hypothetical protein
MPQPPQCAALVRVSVSHPLPARASQSPKPVTQAPIRQAPAAHSAAATPGPTQVRPQLPQWSVARDRSVSQPSPGLPLHSPKPAAQVTAHAEATHAGTVFRGAGHDRPQAPQAVTLLRVSVSHPFPALPSQSPKPALHIPTAHTPAAQAAVAFAGMHARPQPPQWATPVRVSVSHPLAAIPSQSAKPAAQV